MTSLRTPRIVLGCLLAGITLGLTLSAEGQPVPATTPRLPVKKRKSKGGNGKDERNLTEPITLPVEREAKNKIDAVNKYLQGDKVKYPITPKLWEDIISVLQGMLDDPTDKFVEIDSKGNKVSVKREVNRIIGTFDDDGRQFYQRIVGPTAEQKLKQAEDENDMLLMAEVSTRYLHTKAGAEATIRLGTWHLDRGRYAQAAHAFRRFALRNPKDELPAPLLFKAALAYKRQSGSDPSFSKEAARYWDLFEKAANNGQVTIGTKTFSFEQLKSEYDKTVAAGPKFFHDQWGLFRRDPSNNGVGSGSAPFLEPRFSYSYIMPTDDFFFELKPKKEGEMASPGKKPTFEALKERIEKSLKLMESKGIAPIPGVFPIASAGKIVFRGYDAVYCISTKEDNSVKPPFKPGDLIWKQDTNNGLFQMVQLKSRPQLDQFINIYSVNGPYSILIENPLLGSLSHDGQNCYFVDDIAVPPHPTLWQNAMYGGMPQVTFGSFTDATYFNSLIAIELETGKLKWKIGDRTQENRAATNGPGSPPPGHRRNWRAGLRRRSADRSGTPASQGDHGNTSFRLLFPRAAFAARGQALRRHREGWRSAARLPRPLADGVLHSRSGASSKSPHARLVAGARPAERQAAAGFVPAFPVHSSRLFGRHSGRADQRRSRTRHRLVQPQPHLGRELQKQQDDQQLGDGARTRRRLSPGPGQSRNGQWHGL